jgi:hypothetical protein
MFSRVMFCLRKLSAYFNEVREFCIEFTIQIYTGTDYFLIEI